MALNGGEGTGFRSKYPVAYMPWEGYNYEDIILISERLVQDVYLNPY